MDVPHGLYYKKKEKKGHFEVLKKMKVKKQEKGTFLRDIKMKPYNPVVKLFYS